MNPKHVLPLLLTVPGYVMKSSKDLRFGEKTDKTNRLKLDSQWNHETRFSRHLFFMWPDEKHGHVGSLTLNLILDRGFPNGAVSKESSCQCRRCKRCRFYAWMGKIPWSRKWHSTPEFLPGKFHRQRSLVDYSPWGRKESDITERLRTHITFR